MRFEGKLDRWNDDRGFGFIAPTRGGDPVFVHISAFSRDGRRPQVGEALTFEVEPSGDGKKRAIRVERPGVPHRDRLRSAAGERAARRPRGTEHRRSSFGIATAVVLVALGAGLYGQFSGRQSSGAPTPLDSMRTPATSQQFPSAFRCDGRKHCSQMSSCEEAKFFLKNCPDTQMDGDHDGIPCEQQWCTGMFGR